MRYREKYNYNEIHRHAQVQLSFIHAQVQPSFIYAQIQPSHVTTVQNYPSYTQTCAGSSMIKHKHAQVQLSRVTYHTELSFIYTNMPRFKYDQTQTCPRSTMIKRKYKFHITHKNSCPCHINFTILQNSPEYTNMPRFKYHYQNTQISQLYVKS